MLKSIRVLTVVSIFAAQSVMAGDVDLTSGKFTVNERGFATQLLIAKNKAPRSSISSSTAAFLQGSALLTTARGFALNVDAGQTAYINVVTQEKATGADHADCRVFAAIATPSDLSAMAPKLAK